MNRLAVVLLVCVSLIWGANWTFMKIAVAHMQPLWFAVLRLAMGAVTFFVILLALGRVRLPPRHDWPIVASVGLLQMAGFMAMINLGVTVVEAGRSAILAYTTPLWVAPGAMLFLGERVTLRSLAGVILGTAGIAVMFNPMGFDWTNSSVVIGNAILLASAVIWAIAILHVRGHRWEATPLELAPWQMLIGLVPLAVMAWALEGWPKGDTSTEFLVAVAYNGPLATAFAYWGAVTVNRLLPAVTVSLVLLCVPVVGVLVSVIVLGEALTITNVLGQFLIIGGVGAVISGKRKPRSASEGT